MRIALVVLPWGHDDLRARATRGISECWAVPGLQYIPAGFENSFGKRY